MVTNFAGCQKGAELYTKKRLKLRPSRWQPNGVRSLTASMQARCVSSGSCQQRPPGPPLLIFTLFVPQGPEAITHSLSLSLPLRFQRCFPLAFAPMEEQCRAREGALSEACEASGLRSWPLNSNCWLSCLKKEKKEKHKIQRQKRREKKRKKENHLLKEILKTKPTKKKSTNKPQNKTKTSLPTQIHQIHFHKRWRTWISCLFPW